MRSLFVLLIQAMLLTALIAATVFICVTIVFYTNDQIKFAVKEISRSYP